MKNTISTPTSNQKIEIPACTFFIKGVCKNGISCRFRHENDAILDRPLNSPVNINGEKNLAPYNAMIANDKSIIHELNGARVTFEDGAEISSVKLASDFSRIQITGLSSGVSAAFVTGILLGLGFQVPESNILVKALGTEGSVAEVKMEDSGFAKAVIRKFDSSKNVGAGTKIAVKAMGENISKEGQVNRLQLSTVTCTWWRPSRSAWLVFKSQTDAARAKVVLESRAVLGRILTCSLQPGIRFSTSSTLQVGNLDIRTQKTSFDAILHGSMKPQKITLGDPSYRFPDKQAGEHIKGLLQDKGEIDSFEPHFLPGNPKVKATATFINRDAAALAVRSLNNRAQEALGNSKLFVNQVISIKCNVLTCIMETVKDEINRLREKAWKDGHVHLKEYPPPQTSNAITAVRVFGDSLEHVRKAKAELDKILAGTVVMDGALPLWDISFSSPASLHYLNELSRDSKLYIHREAQRGRLLIYGGLPAVRLNVERTLVAKIKALQQLTHTVILTPDLLAKAMQGGMRRLKRRFGASVVLNISTYPKTISIVGSATVVQEAQALLLEYTDQGQGEDDCVVCWTEATDPIRTRCGHFYCRDCFANQASSVGEGKHNLPIRCYGNDGKCLRIFSISDINSMLSATAFEELLKASFDTYVRTRPKNFQHCPTPNCIQIYRISKTGEVVICSICLTPICTTCNVVAHDGTTCEQYKDMFSEDTIAFERWKKEEDGRNCPNCNVTIQKSHGCNHMQCTQCSIHICWFCMETFDTGERCYGHMNKAHRDYSGE
ncbi:hypothetical protein G7Y89_g10062 [Cudoniella acicularis]|uniref:RING-type E3 ubiquitin transferase n=1 Tax=Cudoniella acicularis TaxID=354080 RepID=A0A8H4RH65_9HELO|nr:hypothetical protein G7Y89_g10062 [Cudoniella acicularis]